MQSPGDRAARGINKRAYSRKHRCIRIAAVLLLSLCLVAGTTGGARPVPAYATESRGGEASESKDKETSPAETKKAAAVDESDAEDTDADDQDGIIYTEIDPEDTALIGSTFAALMSGDDGTLIAGKSATEPMYPASMTKIMTVLVAAEHIEHLSETAIVTQRQIDYAIAHDCTTVGFKASEQPTMADLLYGTILISGADAALALAEHIAGSEAAFVELMNERAASLGLTRTHFTNPIGLYAADNVSTAQEMAVILAAAVQNPLVYKVLSTQQYTTTPTRQHPDGITITNMFLLRSGRLQDTGLVLSAKTGFVNQSLYCAASLYITADGRRFICVTGKTDTAMHCVEDHAAMYREFVENLKE